MREDTLCLPLGRGLAAAVIRRNAAGDSVAVTAEGEVPWRKVAREHAAGRPWFERREQIFLPIMTRDFKGKRQRIVRPEGFAQFGTPRQLFADDPLIRQPWDVDGVPVYAERAGSEIQYLPVRPGCWFQPYQLAVIVDYVYDKSWRKPLPPGEHPTASDPRSSP